MCRTLRVLNAVRDPEIGIPLSIQQYKVVYSNYVILTVTKKNEQENHLLFIFFLLQLLTPAVLVARLINAHRHLVALRISEYLGMNQVSLFLKTRPSITLFLCCASYTDEVYYVFYEVPSFTGLKWKI